MKLTKRTLIIPAASLLLLSGCASRVSQFKDFGEAGMDYADTMNKLISASGGLAIDRNSAFLINDERSGGDESNRSKVLKRWNERIEQRLRILNDIAEHNQKLKLYFKALADLAGSDAGTKIATGTTGIVKELSTLNSKISKATLGEAPIGSLVGPATELAVASFQQAALERELNDHAQNIEDELVLQVAAIKAIEESWEYDQKKMLEYSGKISRKQFIQDIALPEHWAENRKAILIAKTSPKVNKSASDAADKLKTAFETLVTKGDKEKVNIQLIVNDLNKVLDMIELVKNGPSA